jgi:Na+/glutamate symporter
MSAVYFTSGLILGIPLGAWLIVQHAISENAKDQKEKKP